MTVVEKAEFAQSYMYQPTRSRRVLVWRRARSAQRGANRDVCRHDRHDAITDADASTLRSVIRAEIGSALSQPPGGAQRPGLVDVSGQPQLVPAQRDQLGGDRLHDPVGGPLGVTDRPLPQVRSGPPARRSEPSPTGRRQIEEMRVRTIAPRPW